MTEAELEDRLSMPSEADVQFAASIDGDAVLLGAGGKMGPSLAVLIQRALRSAGSRHRVIAVLRRDKDGLGSLFASIGIEMLEADLMDPQAIESLPDAPNMIFLMGRKFGSEGQESVTWATNSWAAGMAAYRYRSSRCVVFSTGNVYPFTTAASGGACESLPPAPVGEYAQSALARERVFEYMSQHYGTRALIYRLNYAIDLRYGVLLDIGRKVFEGEPVDLTTGYFNVIWQGEANSYAFRSVGLCNSPAGVLNVTGAGIVEVEQVARAFGSRFGREPILTGQPAPTALLSNAALCHEKLGPSRVSVEEMIEMQAQWILAGGRQLDIPTKFEKRDGKF